MLQDALLAYKPHDSIYIPTERIPCNFVPVRSIMQAVTT